MYRTISLQIRILKTEVASAENIEGRRRGARKTTRRARKRVKFGNTCILFNIVMLSI